MRPRNEKESKTPTAPKASLCEAYERVWPFKRLPDRHQFEGRKGNRICRRCDTPETAVKG